ncbi:hypothetical protein EVAR_52025_1 [Eumeta japonica]|uniref:Uncharacterized protein n=1 Tax=Eumeta variegata TaxID=151549 RepID=A0A4C1YYT5_EUMVA|nr:hypothetical protein EVAR_52025_1 [Eumeta japonica]
MVRVRRRPAAADKPEHARAGGKACGRLQEALCSVQKMSYDFSNCLYKRNRQDGVPCCARGRPIIVEWERRKAFGGPLSFGDSSLRYRALHFSK